MSASPAPAPTRLRVLGTVSLADAAGVLHEVTGARGRALLATLALHAPQEVSAERVIEAVWGSERPAGDRAALHALISRLRRQDGTALLVSGQNGYRIAADSTDLAAAHALARIAEDPHHDPAARAAAARAALGLWHGEPGDDLESAPIAPELREEAAHLAHRLLGAEAQATLDAGEPAAAAALFEPLVGAAPLNENLAGARMRALSQCGRRGEALALFGTLRAHLRDQLGTSPGAELTALNLALLEEEHPEPARASTRLGLIAATTPLLGRDAERDEAEALLTTHRLVTLLGPGGLGKTRLGHEIARRSTAQLVVAVPLASIRNDADVLLALASALGIREVGTGAGARLTTPPVTPDLRNRVLSRLSAGPTLLLLDNCEHVIAGAAAWVDAILAAAPELRIVTTSRSPLGVTGERVLALSTLASTGEGHSAGPAVELFRTRAEAARPGVHLEDATLTRLCTQLDGLPLAIELAAARVRALSLADIERRLEDRFALLRATGGNLPDRHRTLEAVIDWSWQLLRPEAQHALSRLSVFVDGCTAIAAAKVLDTDIDSALDILDALVSQSLLVVHEREDGSLRYRMLETVREFGAQHADPAANDTAFLRWAANFGAEHRALLDSPEQVSAFRDIASEQDNLVSALRLAAAHGDPDTVVRVFALLSYFWSARSTHSDVLGFAPLVLSTLHGYRPDADHANDTALVAAILSMSLGDRTLRPLAILRTLSARGLISDPRLRAIGDFLSVLPRMERAFPLLEAATADPDPATRMLALLLLAQFADNHAEPERAERAAIAGYRAAREQHNTWIAAESAMMLAQFASQAGQAERSLEWLEIAEEGFQLLRVTPDLEELEWVRATNWTILGRLEEARGVFTQFSEAEISGGDHFALPSVGLFGLAEITRREGRLTAAHGLLTQTMHLMEHSDDRESPWLQLVWAGSLAAIQDDGTGDPAELARLAHRLRIRTLVQARLGFRVLDLPVLGSAALGWSAWALHQDAHRELGITLHALGERLGARQDLPGLDRGVRSSRATELVGEDALRRERTAAAALDLDTAAQRVLDLLGAVRDAR